MSDKGWDAPPDTNAWRIPSPEEVGPPKTIEELRCREQQIHVDHVTEIVPFWIRSVQAAELGKVLRFEDFLEDLYARKARGGWGDGGGFWGGRNSSDTDIGRVNKWQVDSATKSNKRQTRWKGKGAAWKKTGKQEPMVLKGLDRVGEERGNLWNPHIFVDDVAKQQAADPERIRKMHSFIDMPTEEKVKRIREVTRS